MLLKLILSNYCRKLATFDFSVFTYFCIASVNLANASQTDHHKHPNPLFLISVALKMMSKKGSMSGTCLSHSLWMWCLILYKGHFLMGFIKFWLQSYIPISTYLGEGLQHCNQWYIWSTICPRDKNHFRSEVHERNGIGKDNCPLLNILVKACIYRKNKWFSVIIQKAIFYN